MKEGTIRHEKKILIWASYLYLYVRKFPQCTCQHLQEFMTNKLIDKKVKMDSMTLATARSIAQLSETSFDELTLMKAILRSYRQRHPINHVETAIESKTMRKCCRCGEWKPHSAFSETSKLCRICKANYDRTRKR